MTFQESCCKCESETSEKLVQIFPGWNSDLDPSALWVCGSCLIGAIIPVIRPSTDQWEFGTVERLVRPNEINASNKNDQTGRSDPTKYCLRFMDSKCEWVFVETTGYDQYIDYHKKRALPPTYMKSNNPGTYFGDEDDQELNDSGDDYDHQSVTRRLEKSFETIGDVDFTTFGPPRMNMMKSPHRISSTRTPLRIQYQMLQYGNSVASPLSISTVLTERRSSIDDQSPFATPTKISPRSRESDSTTTSPKYSQKLWTPEEDQILLSAVSSYSILNLKWSLVAKAVPGRSGKQCRERYLNHLTPNIKLKNWSPVEDAAIFRLYATDGSKWSMMSKLIKGRTDNGIKNRYHHLKRRLERQVHATPTSVEIETIITRLEQCVLLRHYEDWMLKYVATQTVLPPLTTLDRNQAKGYLRRGSNELCARCGLYVPSLQTGQFVCKTTGWCEVCVRLSPCLSGDLLRAMDDVRQMSIGD